MWLAYWTCGWQNCLITNCPITNCPITTWHQLVGEKHEFLEPTTTEKIEIFMINFVISSLLDGNLLVEKGFMPFKHIPAPRKVTIDILRIKANGNILNNYALGK